MPNLVTIAAARPISADQKPQASLSAKATAWKIIKEVARVSLTELAVSFAFVSVTSFFLTTPAGASLLIISALAIVAINTVVRSLGGVFAFCAERNQNPHSFSSKFCRHSLTVCNYIAPLNFSILDSTTRDLVIHEGGHLVAASLLYKNAQPEIIVRPFQGGATSFWTNGLTKLGQFFGEKGSRLIVAGAGPAAAVLVNSAHIGIAHAIRKTHPNLSRYLKVTAIISLVGHIFYALSALTPKNHMPAHDFVALRAGGIHPVASIVAMVALPIIVKLGLCAYDHLKA